jgi:hypothetical protein
MSPDAVGFFNRRFSKATGCNKHASVGSANGGTSEITNFW